MGILTLRFHVSPQLIAMRILIAVRARYKRLLHTGLWFDLCGYILDFYAGYKKIRFSQ